MDTGTDRVKNTHGLPVSITTASELIEIDDELEDVEEPEESAEAELGQYC